MDLLNSVLRSLFGALLGSLYRVPVLWSLLLVSAVAAFVALLLFEGLSDKAVRDRASRRLWANLLAIKLFADSPRVVGQSFGAVMAANAVLLARAIPAFAALTVLFLLCYGHLDAFFGVPTLSVGTPRVLTVRLRHMEGGWPDISLQAPNWIVVDSPPVHVLDDKEISWRIRATQASRGAVKIIDGGEVLEKIIDSRCEPRYFSPARMQSVTEALRYPGETRLPPGPVAEISVLEPPRGISFFGLTLEWTWWFSIFTVLLAVPEKWLLSRSGFWRKT